MSVKHVVNGYVVFTKDDGKKYLNIFQDFLSYNIKIEKVFRNIEDTKVVLIDTPHGKLILKIFAPNSKRTERFFKSLIKGDYYERLFSQTERIREKGVSTINDFYLLAEKKTLRFAHYYIMLIEYIDGVELSEVPVIDDQLKSKIKASISELHNNGMVSGDPHKGNFIIQGNEIRIIDLSGKSPSMTRIAKDRVDLERHYGITNDVKDLGYYQLVFKKRIKNFIRKLKGKEVR